MDESESRLPAEWQICVPRSENEIQYLLKAEEQILQSISAQVPISNILNDICNALDRQIGNMVSVISTPADNGIRAVEVSRSAALFRLHAFCSVVIGAESGEELGSLEMYCSVSRSPSPSEIQLIERANCLAAVAIQHHCEADGGNCRIDRVRSARGYVREIPTSMN